MNIFVTFNKEIVWVCERECYKGQFTGCSGFGKGQRNSLESVGISEILEKILLLIN